MREVDHVHLKVICQVKRRQLLPAFDDSVRSSVSISMQRVFKGKIVDLDTSRLRSEKAVTDSRRLLGMSEGAGGSSYADTQATTVYPSLARRSMMEAKCGLRRTG